MKFSKTQLKKLILEVKENMIEEGELADRKWQDNPANPDSPYHKNKFF